MERKVTDIFWFFFFSFCFVAMIGCIIYGVVEGDLDQLASPYDAAGNLCGWNRDEIKNYYTWSTQAGTCAAGSGEIVLEAVENTATEEVCRARCNEYLQGP
jgi:hypothetical protein